ncbi:MAG: hypothetical protein WCA28_25875 [Bradyrhizobium sp.]
MAKIILIPVSRLRLPQRLLRDGWWLETLPARSKIIALPRSGAPKSGPSPKTRHLTLVTPGK